MKRIAIATLVVAGFLVLSDLLITRIWDGSYNVRIQLAPECKMGTIAVSYVPCRDATIADHVLAHLDKVLDIDATTQRSSAPFEIHVSFSHRESVLGRTWGQSQGWAELIVVLHRVDGSRQIHRVPVPRREESRRVVISDANPVQE